MGGIPRGVAATPARLRRHFQRRPILASISAGEDAPRNAPVLDDGDPRLRSIAEVAGYRIHAADGEIGHVENFLLDSATWSIRYLAVDTRNWWPGKHVLLSPHAVKAINWSERHIQLNVTRDKVKASPPWDPLALMNQAEMERLDAHYGWLGFGA